MDITNKNNMENQDPFNVYIPAYAGETGNLCIVNNAVSNFGQPVRSKCYFLKVPVLENESSQPINPEWYLGWGIWRLNLPYSYEYLDGTRVKEQVLISIPVQ